MSALDELSDTEFTGMMPGLLAMFSKHGWIATPDGVEIINLAASILLTITLVPSAIQLIRGERREGMASGTRG